MSRSGSIMHKPHKPQSCDRFATSRIRNGKSLPGGHIPGAARHEVMCCRTGIVTNAEFLTIPDQRSSAVAPHRVREMLDKITRR
jgi:hypothetical protein